MDHINSSLEESGIPIKPLNEDCVLKKGAFSMVFRGYLKNNNGQQVEVAIKRILKADICKQTNKREEAALCNLNHPNIIKLVGIKDSGPFRCFALELCAASLEQYCMKKYNGPMPCDAAVMLHLVTGLDFIHSKGFVHRNITPRKVLISAKVPVFIVLADFGLTKPVGRNGSYSVSRDHLTEGDQCWKAPEILNNPEDEACCENWGSVASDTFSAGCVIFYFLTRGHHLFCLEPSQSAMITTNICNGKPVGMKDLLDDKPRFKHFIETMIAHNPLERIQLGELQKELKEMVEVYDAPLDAMEEEERPDTPDWLN